MTKTKAKTLQYSCDFETTVYEGQEQTEVWAAAMVNLEAPDDLDSVKIFSSIDGFMWEIFRLSKKFNLHLYFHNLRFDGSFIVNWLERSKYWEQDSVSVYNEDDEYCCEAFEKKHASKMENGQYRYVVSNRGMWYTISLKSHYHTIEIRDSLKLIPFTVEEIGEGFKTKHRKLNMEYEGFRYPGCTITPEEKKYIANDVLVVKEALNFMQSQGHNSLTIGSCCMKEYRGMIGKQFKTLFPNIYNTEFGDINAGEFIRKSYRGGWCYVVPEKAGKDFNRVGTTADGNSLYPSMMHSASGNRYPVGEPTYFKGEIPAEAKSPDKYYFVHIKTRFYIKDGYLPTIQIKGNSFYPSREWLTTSDVIDRRIPGDDKYKIENRKRYFIDYNGIVRAARPDLYLTMTDWEMIQKHYNLEDTEIVDGMYFNAKVGLFDEYINKYAAIKMNSKGPMRQLSKLFLNNLSGKFAASMNSSYKVLYLNENSEMRSYPIEANDKEPGYIPVGAAITSYGRAFTITAAQANYYGPDKPGFIYADTDSIHCDLPSDEIKGAPQHPTKLGYWKYEATWDYAKFVRSKTYIEHVIEENEEPVKPYYNLKCAGMSEHVKQLFLYSIGDNVSRETLEKDGNMKKLDKEETKFIKTPHTMDDFKVGLEIPGMLKARNIKGGTLLVKSHYKMRKTIGD